MGYVGLGAKVLARLVQICLYDAPCMQDAHIVILGMEQCFPPQFHCNEKDALRESSHLSKSQRGNRQV